MSYAGQRMLHGQIRYGIVSRFVDEVPSACANGSWCRRSRRRIWQPDVSHRAAPATPHARRRLGDGKRNKGYGAEDAGRPYGKEGKPDYTPANFENEQTAEFPFGIGQTVMHAKFGEGVVLRFEGRGLDARIEVKFRNEGTKLLALQYAKLTAG